MPLHFLLRGVQGAKKDLGVSLSMSTLAGESGRAGALLGLISSTQTSYPFSAFVAPRTVRVVKFAAVLVPQNVVEPGFSDSCLPYLGIASLMSQLNEDTIRVDILSEKSTGGWCFNVGQTGQVKKQAWCPLRYHDIT